MNSHLIALAATAGLVIAYLVFERRRYQGQSPIPAGVLKGLASAGFVAAALSVDAVGSTGGLFLMGSLLLCLLGDLFLTSRAQALFRMGLFSFLTAHAGYAIFFVILGVDRRFLAATAPLMLGLGAIIYRWLHPHLKAKMRVPVAIYVLVICGMMCLSLSAFGAGRSPLLPAAAAIFMASDVLVARDRFIKAEFTNRLISVPMYYTAQLLLASSPLLLQG